MILSDPQHYGEAPLLAIVADRIGSRLAGRTMPKGLRLYAADGLIRWAGGAMVFDENGQRVPVPKPVLEEGWYLRGISVLRILPAHDEKTNYQFTREITFGRGILAVHRQASSNVIV